MSHVEHPLESQEVVPILATAFFLRLSHLIEMCYEKIKEMGLHCDTAIAIYYVAEPHDHDQLKRLAVGWLERILFSTSTSELELTALKMISPKLMGELVSSPNVIAWEGEYKIYKILRMW